MDALVKQFLTPGMWNLGLNLVVVALGVVYLAATGPWRPMSLKTVTTGQKMLFLTGLALFYISLGSPMALIGHELFSVHMLQQSILYLMMPPLLIRGIPDWMWRRGMKVQWLERFFALGQRPLLSLLLFNGLFSLYHVPQIFDALMGDELLHLLSHMVLILTASLMWWPVVTPLQERTVLSPLRKIAYIAAAGVLLTPACALIIFADHLLFASYSGGDPLFPILSPRDDQQLGGVIMKVLQEIIYASALAHVFFQWVREEREKEEREAVPSSGKPVPSASHLHVVEGGKKEGG
ncbi:cytochrome c oxidase assembly protein [Salinithrix halophila]|uniref:Cytochrome c oxidase assembly protein n=1 Tax=Salinithrix halophila TaxID=1485204 RepID=A0ABV8JLU5_9BACL